MKTLQEFLNNELSPDKVGKMTPNKLLFQLLENNIIDSPADMNRLVIEGVQRALTDGDEFPIKYYAPGEEMPEENKIIDPGECLTDDFIKNTIQS